MKFATKLIGLVSGIFLVTALSITYFVYTSNLKILEKEIKSNLEAQAFHTMDKIDTMLFERYIDIKTLATDPVISSRSHTPVQILGRLMEYQNDYKYYASLSFFDLNRVSIADTSGLYVGKKRDLAEYWKDIAEGKEFVVNLHRSITLDMVVIHFVHIVRDKNGTPFGVVVSRMPVRQLYDIAGFAAGFSDNKTVGYPMIDLVDKNGLLLYSNSNRAVLKDISPYWSVVKDSPSLGKRPDSVKHAYLGEEEITTFVREKGSPDFHGNGWTLIMVVPTKVAFAPAREMRDKIIFISSGFGILSLVIIFFFSRTISGPLLKLSEASVEIGKGNLGKKVDISTNDEIGQMARAFNKMVTDIEEHVQDQKRSEEALKKSESYIHALFDAIPDAIFRISKDGVYLDYKGTHDFPAMVPPSDFLGKRIQDSMPPEVAGTYMHLIKRAAHTGELQRFDYRLEVDTDQRHYESRIVKSAEDEVLAIVRDITEHRKLEEQLLHAQKMEAIGTMAGGIAHEYNNILTAIIGFGEILQDNIDTTDPLRRYVDMIVTSSERAAKITQGLLAYTRKQITHMEPVDVNQIFKTVGGFLSTLIKENVRFTIKTTEQMLTVLADRAQIEQVLINLTTNALDAMPEGGALTIRTELVRFEKDFIDTQAHIPAGAYALISISDTGVGIDKMIRPKIFEPFFTTKDVGKGTGLGLSIVYGIIQKHKGYITVDSAEGYGATFNIHLPLTESGIVEERAGPSLSPAGGTEIVLLAEDNDLVRTIIRQTLEGAGYSVVEAVDGEDALNKYFRCRGKVKLLLFDVAMPKMKGTAAYNEIKKSAPDIKVIFLSGLVHDDASVDGIINQGHTLIRKPVTPKELLKKIREVID